MSDIERLRLAVLDLRRALAAAYGPFLRWVARRLERPSVMLDRAVRRLDPRP